jgi:predicted amidophosphoribosyltransferase
LINYEYNLNNQRLIHQIVSIDMSWEIEWKGDVVAVHRVGDAKHWVYELTEEPYCKDCGNSLLRNTMCWDFHRHRCLTLASGSFQLGKYYGATKLNRQEYRDILTQHIHSLKDNFDFAAPIGTAMALAIMNKYRVLQDADLLVPVPSYGQSRNSSSALCEVIANHLANKGISISVNNALRKIKDITLHKLGSLKEREEAVIGMFEATREISVLGKDVILLDDILTSGDTKGECIKLLKKNGAGQIWVYVAGGNVN